MTTKICNKCKEEKNLSEFHKNKTKKYGHQSECKKCLSNENIIHPELIMLANAKSRARIKKRNINITSDDIKNILTQTCPILNIPLRYGGSKQCDNSASLDRIDSTKGYVKSNIWIISHKANTIKNNGTPEEHRAIADAGEKQLKLKGK